MRTATIIYRFHCNNADHQSDGNKITYGERWCDLEREEKKRLMIISNQRIIGLVMMNGFSRSFQLNCNDLNTKDVNKSLQIYISVLFFM